VGRYRIKAAVVAAAAALLTASGGSAIAAPTEPDTTVERTAGGLANAGTPVPLPDLGFAHRRSDGGINLFRMPLSELEAGFGRPQLVRSLTATSGFLFDRTKVLAGDVADFTAGEDGTADHLLWLRRSDGGVSLAVVPGSSNTTPRSLFVLPARTGWAWVNSRPMVGDVTGDGWDDLVVRNVTPGGDRLWLFESDGSTLLAPVQLTYTRGIGRLADEREYLGWMNVDDGADLLTAQPGSGLSFRTQAPLVSSPATATPFAGLSSAGWSYSNSRQLVGDVTGDGADDVVTVLRSGNGRMIVWGHENCEPTEGISTAAVDCLDAPVLWQDLRGGTLTYAGSRHYLADTDADGLQDLVSIHQTSTGAMTVLRSLSDGTKFLPAQVVANLRSSGGWKWASSRESVANTWGVLE
jgi:hypothetical protein